MANIFDTIPADEAPPAAQPGNIFDAVPADGDTAGSNAAATGNVFDTIPAENGPNLIHRFPGAPHVKPGWVGQSPADQLGSFWQKINTPLLPKPDPTQRLLANARQMQLADEVSPPAAQEELSTDLSQPTKTEKVAGGAFMAVEDTAKFFTSPLGIATLGMGALPKLAQRVIAGAFAVQMAKQTPEIARELGSELGKPEEERDYQKIGNLTTAAIINTGFSAASAAHALGPGEGVVQSPESKGQSPAVSISSASNEAEKTDMPVAKPAEVTPDTLADLQRSLSENQIPKPNVRLPGRDLLDELKQAQSPKSKVREESGTIVPPEVESAASAKSADVSDYDRYQQLVAQLKGKSLDEAQPLMREIEAIKNRNGGKLPKAPLTEPAAGETTIPGAAAETTTGQNARTGAEATAATTLAAEPMPAEVKGEQPNIPPAAPTSKELPDKIIQADFRREADQGFISGSAAEKWADKVIAEGRQRLSAGLDPELLTAYGIKGAALIERGVRDFAAWSGEMVKQFGEAVKPHLEKIWGEARKPLSDLRDKVITHSDRAREARDTAFNLQEERTARHTQAGNDEARLQNLRETNYDEMSDADLKWLANKGDTEARRMLEPQADPVLDYLDSLKLDTRGQLHAFGLLPEAWNKLVDLVVLSIKSGRKLRDAVDWAINRFTLKNPGLKFDEDAAREHFNKTPLGNLRYETPRGKEGEVANPSAMPSELLIRRKRGASEYLGSPEEIAAADRARNEASREKPAGPVEQADFRASAKKVEADPEYAAQKEKFQQMARVRGMANDLRKLMGGAQRETPTVEPAKPAAPETTQKETLSEGELRERESNRKLQAHIAEQEQRAEEYVQRLQASKEAGKQAKKSGPAKFAEWVRERDRYFSQQANHIRQSLLQLARELPPEERAKFTSQISAAMRRPAILSGDVDAMYERAASTAAEIQQHIEDVRAYADRADNIRSWFRSMLKELPMAERGKYVNAAASVMRDPTSKFTGKILADLQEHIDNVKEFDTRAEDIREGMKNLLKELPLAERGRFSAALAGVLQQPTSKFAAKFVARVEQHIEDVHKYDMIQDIKRTVDKALNSPSVDIRYKRMLTTVLNRVAMDQAGESRVELLNNMQREIDRMKQSGAEVFVPQAIQDELRVLSKNRLQDLPVDAVEALLSKVAAIAKVGRAENANRVALMDRKRLEIETDLYRSVMKPFNEKALSDETRPAGTDKTAVMRLVDGVKKTVNSLANVNKAILPIDAVFDMMDGPATGGGPNYAGVLARRFKGTVNLNRQRELVMRDEAIGKLEAIRKKYSLNVRNAERIGVYALLKQEGVRERLINQGETPENLDNIVSTITPGELEYYRTARQLMEQFRPQVADLMHRLYNAELKPEDNYWPLQRDWQKYAKEATPQEAAKLVESGGAGGFDELGTWTDLSPDYRGYLRTSKLEQGFTKQRTKGMTPVKVNAFDVLDAHFRAVTHLLAHQEDLKILGEVARGDLMKEKAGSAGQKIILDWLDTVARDGRVDGHQRNKALDDLRRMITMGIIPWNPVSAFVHTSQIPVSIALVGPNWFRRGAMALMTAEGKKFVSDNMRTLEHRSGSEPAISEVQRGGHPIVNWLFGDESLAAKFMGGYTRAGTFPIRVIDTIHSMTTALGAYQRELAAKGINPDEYASRPVDTEALNRAMAISRRTVASVLPEDMPQILSRGKSFAPRSGNVSFAKTLLQFGNTYLDIWSVIRHDFAGVAVKEAATQRSGKSLLWAGSLGLAIAGSIMWEAGIRHTVRNVAASAVGAPPKKDDEYSAELAHELLRRFPFMGNVLATRYGETGIPVVDTFTSLGKDAYHFSQVKKDDAKWRAATRVGTDVGTIAGLPGASFAGRLVQKSIAPGGGDFSRLDALLDAGKLDAARKEFEALQAEGRTDESFKAHFRNRPFTGSAAREEAFKQSLTPAELKTYQQALADRQQRREAFAEMLKVENP